MDEKKKKLKCYTKTTNAGKQYTTCNDDAQKKKPRKRLVIVDKPKPASAPAVVKKKPRKRLVIVDKPPAARPPPPPARPFVAVKTDVPKPLNYDMLPDEMRRNILQFAGAKSPSDAARDELIDLTTVTFYNPKVNRITNKLSETYVFFVINNTLEKMNLYTLEEDGVETTYKKTPRARTIFLRDPIEVLNEYRDDYIYDEIIAKSLERVRSYKRLQENATPPEEDKAYAPTRQEEGRAMKDAIRKANSLNLLQNNFFPGRSYKKGGNVVNFRTDGIIDNISGGVGMGLKEYIDFLVVMERLYINSNSEEDFKELMKIMNTTLVKNMKNIVAINKKKRAKREEEYAKYISNRDEIERRREELKKMTSELDAFENDNFYY